MLDYIRVKNFKCLRDFEMKPGALNVLVGPNDVGKTSFLQALNVNPLILESGNVETVFFGKNSLENLRWKGDATGYVEFRFEGGFYDKGPKKEYDITFALTERKKPHIYSEYFKNAGRVVFQAGNDGELLSGDKKIIVKERARKETGLHLRRHEKDVAKTHTFFKSFGFFNLSPEEAKKPVALGRDQDLVLESTGAGLARVLEFMKRKNEDAFDEIKRELARAVPGIRGITVDHTDVWVEEERAAVTDAYGDSAVQPKLVKKVGASLAFKMDDGFEVPAVHASDGVILFLAFLTIVHFSRDTKPMVLLVEEPENGIHPKRVHDVLNFFRTLSRGLGSLPPVQVFLTTHSPYLVDHLEPEDVYLLYCDSEGGTRCTPMTEIKNIGKFLEDQYLGEVWFNVGESGLLGKGKKDGKP